MAAAIFIANGSVASPATFSAGFRPALLAVAGLAVIGAVAALAVQKIRVAGPRAATEPAQAVAGAA